VAFQLVEALGVLERHKVADEVKTLDQAARATLRKYGVRFGAFHIYIPALLKPAPRALAAQLWAIKHGDPEHKGADALPSLAASGRTSVPVDKDVSRSLYRVVGYRVCGERAVRVDILERLADVIRPLLAWRPGSPGDKPVGAVDGSGFLVTGAMTSLTGSSKEDFPSILRSLGYRMERRPKPREAASEAAPEPSTPALAPFPDIAPPLATESPDSEQMGAADVTEAAIADSAAPAGTTDSPEGHAGAAAGGGSAAEPASGTEGASDEEMVEVWRPAGPHHRRPRTRPDATPRRPRRQDRAVAAHPPQQHAESGAAKSAEGPRRGSRTRGERRQERNQAPKPAAGAQGRREFKERRERAPDPNSPFAKLAALKAQLEAETKES
jgi:ATP-dependent RNA helicase SUPV3L1/SUV3